MFNPADTIRQAFKDISDAELEALCSVAQTRTYPAGQVLVREGEVEHVFYIVATGEVAITHKLGPSQERLIAVRKQGEYFGEMALIENKPRSASATTLTETGVLEITEEVFNDFLAKSPGMALSMIRHITANLRTADQAAIKELSVKNAELAQAYDELKEAQNDIVAKERMERELEIAGEVQRNLLPAQVPTTPGYRYAASNSPARHVGGDFYDVLKVDNEHVGLLLADVSDKGVHAALIMAVTRTLFVAHARRSVSPAEVCLAVHNGLLEVAENDDMFVTVFYGVLNLASGSLTYVRAGQDKPLIFRAQGGAPERLDAEGRFLGMLPGLTLEERRVTVARGDLLVAYSDGVPDAVNMAGDSYGPERLTDLLEAHRRETADKVCAAILEDVFAFRGPAPAFDDITVLVMRAEAG